MSIQKTFHLCHLRYRQVRFAAWRFSYLFLRLFTCSSGSNSRLRVWLCSFRELVCVPLRATASRQLSAPPAAVLLAAPRDCAPDWPSPDCYHVPSIHSAADASSQSNIPPANAAASTGAAMQEDKAQQESPVNKVQPIHCRTKQTRFVFLSYFPFIKLYQQYKRKTTHLYSHSYSLYHLSIYIHIYPS